MYIVLIPEELFSYFSCFSLLLVVCSLKRKLQCLLVLIKPQKHIFSNEDKIFIKAEMYHLCNILRGAFRDKLRGGGANPKFRKVFPPFSTILSKFRKSKAGGAPISAPPPEHASYLYRVTLWICVLKTALYCLKKTIV